MRFTSPTLAISYISARAASQIFASHEAQEATSTNEFTSSSNGSLQEGAECSFANDVKAELSDVDTGVLVCSIGEKCIEDKSSSVGGRCITIHPRIVAENHRQLTAIPCTFTNGTKGVKCNPIDACAGINTEYISCGSCIGEASCLFTGGSIGESSCIGRRSCFSVLGDVDQLSCTGNFACYNHQCEFNPCSSH
jgi:hypothetical protein